MRLSRVKQPQPSRWATALDRGDWEVTRCHEPDGPLVWFHPRAPLRLEWDVGDRWHRNPTLLGDFAHAPPRVALRTGLADELARFSGWEPSPVELLSGPRELAFENSALTEMQVVRWVHADMERSTFEEDERCTKCGRMTLLLTGTERKRMDPLLKGPEPFVSEDRPRQPGMGLFVRTSALEGASVFRVHEFGGIMVTADLVDYVKRRRFTNIDFREVGETF